MPVLEHSFAAPVKPRPWSVDEVLHGLEDLDTPRVDRAAARTTLWDDVTSEYDATLLSAHLHALPIELSERFLAAEHVWAEDERLHHAGFLRIYAALFEPERGAELAERRADFGPLAHLFEDELAILVLCAYDELTTVRAFAANLSRYDALGVPVGRYVRRVIADEAWHYSVFLDVLRQEHAERLPEARAILDQVLAAEGTPYACTFVLDHDGDEVWSNNDEIYAGAKRSLLAHLS